MAKRLRRYRESYTRKQNNKLFKTNERAFYKKLTELDISTKNEGLQLPTPEVVQDFWSKIWDDPVCHTPARWIEEEKEITANLNSMENWMVTPENVRHAISKTLNWKAPGADGIHNFWYKRFTSMHSQLAKNITMVIQNPEEMPDFLTHGVTTLIPKGSETNNPSNYRPITCLPTMYKLITSILTDKIYQHLESNKLLDEEQKGCRRGSRGCKEQLVIDATIMHTAKYQKKALYTAYIDYQKAFDSVPHSWLVEVLQIYKIEEHISQFLAHIMTKWQTKLVLNTPKNNLEVGTVQIKRGIYQGDSLSPLWFCLALRPLTRMLTNQQKGFVFPHSKREISHLWYMDDLKLYSRKKEDLNTLLDVVGQFSTDISMNFGLGKCKISAMEKGKWIQHEGYDTETQGKVESMTEDERYKYLGYQQSTGIDHKEAKKTTTEAYLKRIRSILKAKLSGINTAKAVNTYATSAIIYSFGVIKWTKTELEDLNRMTRKEFKKQRAHHPKSAVERFHLPRKSGGRGIPDLVQRHQGQIENLRSYFYKRANESDLHRTIVAADAKYTPLRLADQGYKMADIEKPNQTIEKWKGKVLHGRYPTSLDNENIDRQASTAYLRHGNLFAETEGFISAIQDQVIPTKAYKKTVFKEQIDNIKCRMCNAHPEYLDHIIDGCPVLAPKEYLQRHDKVGNIIHLQLRKKYMNFDGMDEQPYYKYTPEAVQEDENVRIYWNRKIQTDKTILHNIPDLVLTHKKDKTTYIVDFAIPLGANIAKTCSEKINKYIPLADEIKEMWNMDKVQIIPIIIGSLGEIPVKTIKGLEQLGLDKNTTTQMQKAVILDTCNIVRRVMGTAI